MSVQITTTTTTTEEETIIEEEIDTRPTHHEIDDFEEAQEKLLELWERKREKVS